MAYTLTYDTLVASIQNYLERDDQHLVLQIPQFIMLGQRRIAHDLKILGFKTFISGVLSPSINIIPKPADWLTNATFNIGTNLQGQTGYNNKVNILECSLEKAYIYWPDQTQTSTPIYYTDKTFNQWLLVPTPDQAYPFELGYYGLGDLLGPSVQVNWATQNAPEALLYASLLATPIYLKDDDRVAVWESYYVKAISALNEEDKLRIYDDYSVRRG